MHRPDPNSADGSLVTREPLRLVWNLTQTMTYDAFATLLSALEAALDAAMGQVGELEWGEAVAGGWAQGELREHLNQPRHRRYAGDVLIKVADTERWPEQEPGAGVSTSTTLFVWTPGPWHTAWALHQQLAPSLAALGYTPATLSWPTVAEALCAQLEASGDAGLEDFIAECDAMLREVAANTPHVLELRRRPYLDHEALLRLAPPTLQRLYLSHNKLSAVPEAVRRFTMLEELVLYDNPLTALPSWLPELTALRTLNIQHTRLDGPTRDALRAALPGVRISD